MTPQDRARYEAVADWNERMAIWASRHDRRSVPRFKANAAYCRRMASQS